MLGDEGARGGVHRLGRSLKEEFPLFVRKKLDVDVDQKILMRYKQYCGRCGGPLTPENFSSMSHLCRADLEKVGIYIFGINKAGEKVEGWGLRPK